MVFNFSMFISNVSIVQLYDIYAEVITVTFAVYVFLLVTE